MQIQWIKRHGGRHSWSGEALEIRFGKVLLSRLGRKAAAGRTINAKDQLGFGLGRNSDWPNEDA
jgi:hypothetical protein